MIIVALIFVLAGVLVKYGKMYFLLAGYNTMSQEERARYHIEGLAHLFFTVMMAMAISILLGYALAHWFRYPPIEYITMFITIIAGIPYLLVKANSKRYRLF